MWAPVFRFAYPTLHSAKRGRDTHFGATNSPTRRSFRTSSLLFIIKSPGQTKISIRKSPFHGAFFLFDFPISTMSVDVFFRGPNTLRWIDDWDAWEKNIPSTAAYWFSEGETLFNLLKSTCKARARRSHVWKWTGGSLSFSSLLPFSPSPLLPFSPSSLLSLLKKIESKGLRFSLPCRLSVIL